MGLNRKVGLLAYGLGPLSGIGRYTIELTRALACSSNDLDLTLLVAGGGEGVGLEDGVARASLPACRLLPGLMTLGNALIPHMASRLGLQVVHDPSGVAPFLFGAGNARTIVTVHDVFAQSCPGNSTLAEIYISRYWLPPVLRRVDAVITVSQKSKQDIMHYLKVPSHRIHIVYEGVSLGYYPIQFDAAARVAARHGLAPGYILSLGSVQKRKNLHGLLSAYALLRRKGIQAPLVVAGARRWPYADLERSLESLGLRPHVIFTGYLADADLPALYSAAALFVFPSLYEGFGLPPLEAMACGVPVVCSNAASLPEVVGDAALAVDPYDVERLAEAMYRVLIDGNLREQLRAAGLARARQFSWQRTASQTVSVYKRVCE